MHKRWVGHFGPVTLSLSPECQALATSWLINFYQTMNQHSVDLEKADTAHAKKVKKKKECIIRYQGVPLHIKTVKIAIKMTR